VAHFSPILPFEFAFLLHRRHPGAVMKLIVTVVRPERLSAVKEALFRIGVTGMTLSRVSGHGGEGEIVEHYRGSAVLLEFHEKVRIEIAVSEPFVEPTIRAIVAAAQTGEVGDGKVFVLPLERVVRIRTGERDVEALTPVTADDVQLRANLQHAEHAEHVEHAGSAEHAVAES
jgi:nitrogen regulatory protein P-II 1